MTSQAQQMQQTTLETYSSSQQSIELQSPTQSYDIFTQNFTRSYTSTSNVENFAISTENYVTALNENFDNSTAIMESGSEQKITTPWSVFDNATADMEHGYYVDEAYNAAGDRMIYTKFYMLGFILPLGLFFNTFAFIVFLWSPNIRRTTTGKFLIALTIADNTFLIGDYFRWLNSSDLEGPILGLEFAETNFIWCSVTFFLRYFGQLVSGWLTVAITAERFIVVAFPFKATRISTTKSTNVAIMVIYVASAALTVFPFWTLHINYDEKYDVSWCSYKDQDVFNIWNWVVIRMASLLLPAVIIFIFTGLIIFKLRQLSQSRLGMSGLSSLPGKGRRHALERQLTAMLVAVAVTFLILRLPYMIAYYLFDFRENIFGRDLESEEDKWFKHRLMFARHACDAIATLNYSINFFLYCLTGSQFRSNMASCLKCETVKVIRSKLYTSTMNNEYRLKVNQTSTSNLSLSCNNPNKISMEFNGTNKKQNLRI